MQRTRPAGPHAAAGSPPRDTEHGPDYVLVARPVSAAGHRRARPGVLLVQRAGGGVRDADARDLGTPDGHRDAARQVVDRGGNALVTLRGDGAGPQSQESAERKAFTAASWNAPTSEPAGLPVVLVSGAPWRAHDRAGVE